MLGCKSIGKAGASRAFLLSAHRPRVNTSSGRASHSSEAQWRLEIPSTAHLCSGRSRRPSASACSSRKAPRSCARWDSAPRASADARTSCSPCAPWRHNRMCTVHWVWPITDGHTALSSTCSQPEMRPEMRPGHERQHVGDRGSRAACSCGWGSPRGGKGGGGCVRAGGGGGRGAT